MLDAGGQQDQQGPSGSEDVRVWSEEEMEVEWTSRNYHGWRPIVMD